jgi:hypothetical protein
MKKFLLLALLTLVATLSYSQDRKIQGTLIDHDAEEPIPQMTIQLLKMDSTFVTGTVSNDSGKFVVQVPEDGRYLLKLSSIGYPTTVKHIQIKDGHDLNMGTIILSADAVMLKEAQVTARALKVTVKEDTFIYNSAAYRTPEGSTIEELVKRLPGATVDDDGKITINGKEVTKILVDGKEFMTGDTKTAMKNIPTSIIDKVKSYDEKSDLARVTGIDDGNEQTVLDFGTKPGMHQGFMSNLDVGLGTHDRYSSRLFSGYFNKTSRIIGMGNANNVNDMGFGGRGGNFGRGRSGLNATKMAGLNFNYENKGKLKIDGSLRWNHSDGDARSKTSTENFVSTTGAFSNSLSQNYTRSNSWDGRARIEWTPDTLTNIMFRPTLKISTSDGLTQSSSASFNADPYDYVDDPLSDESISQLANDSIMVNTRNNNTMSYTESKSVGAMLQYNRRLNNMGRNFTLRADLDYEDNDSKSLSTSNVHLYQVKNAMGADSTYQTNRYNLTPSKNWSYALQFTYSEPLWKATFLQLSYQYKYSYQKSDRSTYDFSNLGEDFFSDVTPAYRSWESYLGRLEHDYTYYRDDDLSRFAEYKNYTHRIELMFRMIRDKYRLNVGVMVQPQRSHYTQDYQGVSVDTVRTVTNVSPTFDFRYRFNKVSNLRINYRASTTQPSISQLLDIYDDSDPLNISTGNLGLKPSFTQRFRFFYRSYFEKTQRAMMANLNFSTTRNSISNKVTYNETTGGRITRPENINGDWNLRSAFMFNTPLDTAGLWNINTFTTLDYAHDVGYVTLSSTENSQKNITKDMTLGERLSGSYRNSWLEVELDGNLQYRHSRNTLQTSSNLDTWQFAYGVNVNLTAPWGMSISTDLHENSRRGYSDNSLNTNELVWNAQISQSFLKGKPLTVMLQFYDILDNQSNFSRTLSAMSRTDTEYNSINCYAMVHVIYNFNLFGSKGDHEDMMGPDRDHRRGSGGRPGGFGRPGGGPGGFGGGRPGGRMF